MKKVCFVLCFVMIFTSLGVLGSITASAETFWGIDVSRWQGDINWSQVKSAGVEFAILNAYSKSGSPPEDIKFESNYAEARDAGVPIGAYVRTYAVTIADAKTEAAHFLDIIEGKVFEYPIWVDVENYDYYNLTPSTVSSITKVYLDALEDAGFFAGVYTYTSFAYSAIDWSMLTEYDTWIAQYASECTYTNDYTMWQYSSTGSVSGISGNVDMNYSYVDYPTKISALGLNNLNPNTVVPSEITNGLLLYDGDNITGTTNDFDTETTIDTANKREGGGSLKINPTHPKGQENVVGAMAFLHFRGKVDLSSYDIAKFYLYLSADQGENEGAFQINFASYGQQDGFNYAIDIKGFNAGWTTITIPLSNNYRVIDAADWSAIDTIRFTWFNNAQITGQSFNVDYLTVYTHPSGTVVRPWGDELNGNLLWMDDCDTNDGFKSYNSCGTYMHTDDLTREGGGCVVLNCTAPTGQTGNIGGKTVDNFYSQTDLSKYDYFQFYLYITNPHNGSDGKFQVNFVTDTYDNNFDGYNYTIDISNYAKGWHLITLKRADALRAVTSAQWSRIQMISFTWINNGKIPAQKFMFDRMTAFSSNDIREARVEYYDNGTLSDPQCAVTLVDANGDYYDAVSSGAVNTFLLKDGQYTVYENGVATSEVFTVSVQNLVKTIGSTVYVPDGICGDADLNDTVNSTDALLVLQFSVSKISFSEKQLSLSDVNKSGTVNSVDAMLILQYAVELIDALPVEVQ